MSAAKPAPRAYLRNIYGLRGEAKSAPRCPGAHNRRVAQANKGGARLRTPPRLTCTAGERNCSRVGLAPGASEKAMAVRMMATAGANCATVTHAGQWLAGACPPEPPWPGAVWAPSAVQMTSGPSTSSTRDAAIAGASDGDASTLLRRAMTAIHPRIRLWRRSLNMSARLVAARVPVNRRHLPHGVRLLGPVSNPANAAALVYGGS